jgi:hypothetical protein
MRLDKPRAISNSWRRAALSLGTWAMAIGVAAAGICVPGMVRAGQARPAAYALVIGVNKGGPGQKRLRYAHDDARRIKRVLAELGGVTAGNIALVLEPTREALLAALARADKRLAAAKRAGKRPLFFFYYSGHARARALNLGTQELPLMLLRKKLLVLPSTATVAILDACQTGAISRVKGAAPTADFSYNSTRDLHTAGVAVLASSSGSELSQETDSLRSSYFTHNLVVALRGAADADEDGRVTLGEAYRYAYDRTLIATAKTAVGKQHVTLETRMRGKGALVLTYPAKASAQLVLPAKLAGEVLVHRPPARHVMAELSKAKGKRLRIALPPGRYVALVRPGVMAGSRAKGFYRCKVALRSGVPAAIDLPACSFERPTPVVTKGHNPALNASGWPRLALEVGFGPFFGGSDAYDTRLEDFGFERQQGFLDLDPALSVALGWVLNDYLTVGARFTMFDRGRYTRDLYDLDGERREQAFSWETYGVGIYARGSLPLFRGVLLPYAQVGAGLGFGSSTLVDPLQASTIEDDELHWGYYLSAGLGLAIMPWRHIGFFGQLDIDYAPVVENLVGDTHDSGGARFVIGLRGAL